MNSPYDLLTKAQKLRVKLLKEAYGQQKKRQTVLSFLSSFTGMRELNTKLLDMAHANADAVFDLAHERQSTL